MLTFSLKATNSSGRQYLTIDTDSDGHHITIFGEYRAEKIQIDFEPLGDSDLSDLICMLSARLKGGEE